MIITRDQMDQEVRISSSRRIVSLVPSQTELLFDLGLTERIAGVTRFCVHPVEARQKTIVGGTKNIDLTVIHELQPDLIIGNKEENEEEAIRALQSRYPVWMSDIATLTDALAMIRTVSRITSAEEAGDEIIQSIQQEWKTLPSFNPLRTLYLIWRKPWMAAGGDTFIHSQLSALGLKNIVEDHRYPHLSNEQLIRLNPELILLSSEPYPFREKHIQEIKSLLPQAQLILVDGELFSWYGSRLIKAPAYFSSLRTQLS